MSRLIIDKKDNVAVTLTGEGNIPAGHKLALRDISRGEKIIKYGEVIGVAKEAGRKLCR